MRSEHAMRTCMYTYVSHKYLTRRAFTDHRAHKIKYVRTNTQTRMHNPIIYMFKYK